MPTQMPMPNPIIDFNQSFLNHPTIFWLIYSFSMLIVLVSTINYNFDVFLFYREHKIKMMSILAINWLMIISLIIFGITKQLMLAPTINLVIIMVNCLLQYPLSVWLCTHTKTNILASTNRLKQIDQRCNLAVTLGWLAIYFSWVQHMLLTHYNLLMLVSATLVVIFAGVTCILGVRWLTKHMKTN